MNLQMDVLYVVTVMNYFDILLKIMLHGTCFVVTLTAVIAKTFHLMDGFFVLFL